MTNSNSKSSFRIDDILCHTKSVANLLIPMASTFSDSPPISFNDSLKNQAIFFPQLIDFPSSRYCFPQPPHPQASPLTYLDSNAGPFLKAVPSGYMPYYSHPFNGYLLPGCTYKRKGGQVRFTPQQTHHLELQFHNHKYLSPDDRKKLANQLKLSDRQVKTWFQNRRAKWRRTRSTANRSSAKNETINKCMPDSLAPINQHHNRCTAEEKHTINHHVDSTTKSCCSPSDS